MPAQSTNPRTNLALGASFSERNQWALDDALYLLDVPHLWIAFNVPYGSFIDAKRSIDLFLHFKDGEKKWSKSLGYRFRDKVPYKDVTFREETVNCKVSQTTKCFEKGYCQLDLTVNIDEASRCVIWAVLLDLDVLREDLAWMNHPAVERKQNRTPGNDFLVVPIQQLDEILGEARAERAIIARWGI